MYLYFNDITNRDYVQTFCKNRRNTFSFACRQWYTGILT